MEVRPLSTPVLCALDIRTVRTALEDLSLVSLISHDLVSYDVIDRILLWGTSGWLSFQPYYGQTKYCWNVSVAPNVLFRSWVYGGSRGADHSGFNWEVGPNYVRLFLVTKLICINFSTLIGCIYEVFITHFSFCTQPEWGGVQFYFFNIFQHFLMRWAEQSIGSFLCIISVTFTPWTLHF